MLSTRVWLFVAADAEIVPTLPSLKNPPATFQDCVEFGPYIFRGLTPEERKDGTFHSAQVLHIPGQQGSISTCQSSAGMF